MPENTTEARIRALVRARADLEARGLTEQLARVDAELRELSRQARRPALRAEKR